MTPETIFARVVLEHAGAAQICVSQLFTGSTIEALGFVRRGTRGEGVKHAFTSGDVTMLARACWQESEIDTLWKVNDEIGQDGDRQMKRFTALQRRR